MTKPLFIISLILAFALSIFPQAFGQRANNWIFGNFGLDFNAETVEVLYDYANHQNRGMGVISDEQGKLLCYTDGYTIWNRNHSVMTNGDNITTILNTINIATSTIVPKPGSDSIYYVFTVHPFNGHSASGLYYSVIDLTLENGLGAVTLKGVKILEKTGNKMTAVYHNNEHYVWIVTHQDDTDKYFAFLLTEEGLSETPVISALGYQLSTSLDGQLKSSTDGLKMAISYNDYRINDNGFTLFDFDNSTGILSNPLIFALPVYYRGGGSLEYSSDSKYLFVHQPGSTGESAVYQYDITLGTYEEINQSRTMIFQPEVNGLVDMQLAPDGKIYFTKGGGQSNGTEYLGVIENPTDPGSEIVARELGLHLGGADAFVARTPTFIQNYFFKTSFSFSNPCSGEPVNFKITNEAGLDSVRWDFGPGNYSQSLQPYYTYDTPGEYDVTLLAFYPDRTDTIRKQITVLPSPALDLGLETTVCFGHELSVAEGFNSYLWNTGDLSRSILITQPGNYILTVENEHNCFTTDSVFLNVAQLPVIELPDSIQLGTNDSILVDAGNFNSYEWSTGETTSSIYIKEEGWYSVAVEDETGCMGSKSFYVFIDQPNEIDSNDWILLNPQPSGLTGLDLHFLNSQVGFILNPKHILGTTDGGTTWEIIMDISSGKKMAFKDNFGYVVGNNGAIYKSTHMGQGWNKINTSFTEDFTGVSVISKDTVFITGTQNLYFSFDGGQNWDSSEIPNTYISCSFFTSSKVGHVGSSDGSVYKTVDGGATWDLKSSHNTSSRSINAMYFADASTGYISRGYMGTMLKTTDGGETWNTNTSIHDDVHTFHFLDAQNGFCAGEHGAIYKTTDGGLTWTWISFQNARYAGTDIYGLYFIDSMRGFATGLSGRIVKTTDGGNSWSEYAASYKKITGVEWVTEKTGYALAGNAFIKTTDGGKSWIDLGIPYPPGNTIQFDFINENIGYCIAGGQSGTSAYTNRVYKTVDGGNTWTATNGGLGLVVHGTLQAITFLNENTGFASGGYGATLKTTNGGTTWNRINDFAFRQMKFINSLVGYARTYDKIYKTQNGGTTWTPVFSPDQYGSITSFDFVDENNGYITGGSSSEVFKTSDAGNTWQKLEVPYNYYTNIKFHSANVGFIIEDYGKIYQTNNGGISWSQLISPYWVNGIELFGDDIFAYGGSGIIVKKKLEYDLVVFTVFPANNITANSAKIQANITSNHQLITNIKLEYGTGPLTNSLVVEPNLVEPDASLNQSYDLTGLEPEQTYNFRLTALADDISYESELYQFSTLPEYILYMDNVYNVSLDYANVSAHVVSNAGEIKNLEFQFGTDTTFAFKTPAQPGFVAAGTTNSVSAQINSLEPQTAYFIRIKGEYAGREIYSLPVKFTTLSEYLIELNHPYIIGNDATFGMYIRANKDHITNIELEYGTTRDYTSKVEVTGEIPKGTAQILNTNLTGLDPSTVYYCRIKANMGSEIIYGNEIILKLEGGVIMVPAGFEQLSDTTLVLKGFINPQGSYLTELKFEYGLTENLEDSKFIRPFSLYGNYTQLVSDTLFDLIPNVKYYARLNARHGVNSISSDIFEFILLKIADSDVLIYPNPSTDYIRLKSAKPIDKVEIYDSSGKLYLSALTGDIIYLPDWQKGLFIVRIYMGDTVVTKNIVKN